LKLAERKHTALFFLPQISSLGKTRVITGDAAGSPFTLNTSVIGCTSQLLFEHKPPEDSFVRRSIEIRPSKNKQIKVYTLEKGRATVAKRRDKWKGSRFHQALSHTKLETHEAAINFVHRCVKAHRCRTTPRNLPSSSRSHRSIYFDFVAMGENRELLLDDIDDPCDTIVFSDLAGNETGEVETADINAGLGGDTNTMPLCLLTPVSHVSHCVDLMTSALCRALSVVRCVRSWLRAH